MSNKTLFVIGDVKFNQKTILTIFGVALGIYLIKKMSESKNATTLVVEEETAGFANYVDENFFNYVDEGFMGMGGDESMKFGGGKPIAFASANGTDNAIYEPNFFNSDGKVPVATDEPNFANSDGNPFLRPATKKRQDLVGGGSQQESDNIVRIPKTRATIDMRKGKTQMRYGDRGRISG
jgi:hypothetical protein